MSLVALRRPRSIFRLLVIAVLGVCLASPPARSQTVQCPVIADAAAIPNYEGDIADACAGGGKTINIEGFESLGMFAFDMAPAKGLKIERAELLLKRDAGELVALTVSTIAAPWKPTRASDAKDTEPQEGCSSYSWRVWSKDPAKRQFWAGPGSHLSDAIFGQGHSLCAEVRAELDADGWYHIPVPAAMAAALASGTQHGLCLYDAAGQRRTPGTVLSATGGQGGYLRITGKTLKVQMRPVPAPTDAEGATPRVWAVPETENISPTTGNRLQGGLDEYIQGPARGTHRLANEIWSGADKTVNLEGGRNWFCGFQLVAELEGKTRRLQIQADDLSGPQALSAAKNIKIYRAWYVRGAKGKEQEGWFADPLIPVTDAVSLPAKDNAVAGQINQAFFVDLYVPHQAKPGTYKATLHVTDLDDPAYQADVALAVKVHPVTLPDTLTFIPEMNAYSSPAKIFKDAPAGSAHYLQVEREYHRLAHSHRCNLNILGYGQVGQTKDNYVPKLEGAGQDVHVADWSKFDEQFGPYLDGSAFADLPRGKVPVPAMYLPFHENWPNPVSMMTPEGQASVMKGLLPKYRPAGADAFIAEHYKGDLPMEQLFPPAYEQGDIAVARQFRDHFQAKGWTQTDFQIYLNNKYYWREVKAGQSGQASAWWLLDEPNHHTDILALRYYGQLFKKGFEGAAPVRVIYRCDISRLQWVRDLLDGVLDMIAVSRRFNLEHAWLADKSERLGWQVWSYSGHMNSPSQPHRISRTWCLNGWLNQAHGILHWQTIGQDADYAKANSEALLLPGQRFGIDGPVGTIRVKMWRSAQQDVELLNLLAGQPGWDRKSVGTALAAACQQAGLGNYLYIDPVTTAFDVNHDTPYGFYEALRQAVYAALPNGTAHP